MTNATRLITMTTCMYFFLIVCKPPPRKTHHIVYCESVVNGEKISVPVLVESDPAAKYTTIVTNTDLKFKGSIEILDKIRLASIDAGITRNVILLREKLNQFNIAQQDLLKASFIRSNNRPCDTAIQNAHTVFLDENGKRNTRVAELTASLNALTTNGTVIRYSDGQSIQFILNGYKESIKDTSVAFMRQGLDTLQTSGLRSQYYYFPNEPNGSIRLKNRIANSDSVSYYPEDKELELDSINLGNDFIIEANVRSMDSAQACFGLIYNSSSVLDGKGYFLIIKYSGRNYSIICAGVRRNSRKFFESQIQESFSKLLFIQKLNIDITQFHELQIKKTGENIEYYIDNLKLHSTNSTRIETKKFKFYVESFSDCLFKYLKGYY